jgi:hypothetical protein
MSSVWRPVLEFSRTLASRIAASVPPVINDRAPDNSIAATLAAEGRVLARYSTWAG